MVDRAYRRRRFHLGLVVTVLVVLVTGAAPFLFQTSPRGLIRALPVPAWLDVTRNDELAYQFHAGLGTVLNMTGIRSAAAASEWFKAAWHARSNQQIEASANGLLVAEQHSTAAQLEQALCPYLSEWSPENSWGARGRQLATLMRANLTCGEQTVIAGMVPDDVPIQYTTNPPAGGLYHETWYQGSAVTTDAIAPEIWVHNLAHGQIVLLYRCPDGCADVVAQAQRLYDSLPPGRNSRGSGARLIVTRYDNMDHSLAVVGPGESLALDRFDPEQIVEFYTTHVDRGAECHNLSCPP